MKTPLDSKGRKPSSEAKHLKKGVSLCPTCKQPILNKIKPAPYLKIPKLPTGSSLRREQGRSLKRRRFNPVTFIEVLAILAMISLMIFFLVGD